MLSIRPLRRVLAATMLAIGIASVAFASPAWSESVLNLAYGPNAKHRADVFLPARGAKGLRTAIVFIHGGGWRRGSRKRLRFIGRALAEMGHVAVSIDYRLYPEVTFPAFVVDGARAVAWVRASASRFGIAPDRIYLMGHSAGAHIAMLLALDRRYLKAFGVPHESIRGAIGLAGPYSFRPHRLARLRRIFEHDPEAARPINYARNTGPRLLLLHGRSDGVVPAQQATDLAEAYRRAGGSVRLKIFDGVGHNGVLLAFASALRWRVPVFQEVRGFVGAPSNGK